MTGWRRWFRRAAVAGLASAVVPLTLWAVPASHSTPAVSLRWTDYGDALVQRATRQGLDRDGFVYQQRDLVWQSRGPSALDELRARHRADPASLAELPRADAWRPQFSTYGNNHVWLPGGMTLTDSGVIVTVPYHLVAAMLAAPAAAWGAAAAWRRVAGRR
jgi:hypothetical protein